MCLLRDVAGASTEITNRTTGTGEKWGEGGGKLINHLFKSIIKSEKAPTD